jgi:hypothetical protein
MNQDINKTSFGSITIQGNRYEHDIIIRMDGRILKRKKKLSKRIFGTSHIISIDEAKYIFEKGAKHLIIGSGQYGQVTLSEEAEKYFKKKECEVKIFPTPEALKQWNIQEKGAVIALFHLTC